MDFSSALKWDSSTYSGELIMSFVAMGIVAILAFSIGIVFHKKDPTKKDENKFITVVCALVEKLDDSIIEIMGKKWSQFSGYVMALSLYIIMCFLVGLTGLPNPLTNLTCPLSIGLITFVMIHATAIKANKWKYFKRYVDPIWAFLPINLLSMWAPLLSITLRLFGNALAGYCLMSIVYFYLQQLSATIFAFVPTGWNSIILAPFITPWLHLYFDLFSGLIQTLVFCILTMIWVSNEDPQEDDEDDQMFLKQESVTQ